MGANSDAITVLNHCLLEYDVRRLRHLWRSKFTICYALCLTALGASLLPAGLYLISYMALIAWLFMHEPKDDFASALTEPLTPEARAAYQALRIPANALTQVSNPPHDLGDLADVRRALRQCSNSRPH